MRIEPDLAAVYLARYGWLYERAVEVWLHERFEDENEDGVEEWKSGVGYVSLGEWRRGMREVEEEEDSDEESESESDSEDEDVSSHSLTSPLSIHLFHLTPTFPPSPLTTSLNLLPSTLHTY